MIILVEILYSAFSIVNCVQQRRAHLVSVSMASEREGKEHDWDWHRITTA